MGATKIVHNGSGEVLKYQFAGVMISVEPGEERELEKTAARHLYRHLKSRGLRLLPSKAEQEAAAAGATVKKDIAEVKKEAVKVEAATAKEILAKNEIEAKRSEETAEVVKDKPKEAVLEAFSIATAKKPLKEMTVKELLVVSSRFPSIVGEHSMKKAELIKAIEKVVADAKK